MDQVVGLLMMLMFWLFVYCALALLAVMLEWGEGYLGGDGDCVTEAESAGDTRP